MGKILLLGDSICIGYRTYVEKLLYGWADVIYPQENTRFSTYLLRNLPTYRNEMNINCEDVRAVVFNSGLWDVVRVDCEVLVSKETYGGNIRRIINVLKSQYPKAMIFFATSTYPKCDSELEPGAYRRIDDVKEYNEIALELLKKDEYVKVIDFGKCQEKLNDKYIDSVHYNDEGYKLLARNVVDVLKKNSCIENKTNSMWGDDLFDEYVIDDIEILFKRKIAIYGAGDYGNKCNKELKEKGIKSVCFIDASQDKIGTMIDDTKVLSIDEYERNIENVNEEVIIIAIKDSMIVGDIITMLKGRGHKCICSMSILNYITKEVEN